MRDCLDGIQFERPNPTKLGGACGNMDARKLVLYNEKLIELRKTDPIIDWSEEKILIVGQRHIAHWMLSEIEDN